MNGPEGFLPKKTKFHDAGGPGTMVSPTVNFGIVIPFNGKVSVVVLIGFWFQFWND